MRGAVRHCIALAFMWSVLTAQLRPLPVSVERKIDVWSGGYVISAIENATIWRLRVAEPLLVNVSRWCLD